LPAPTQHSILSEPYSFIDSTLYNNRKDLECLVGVVILQNIERAPLINRKKAIIFFMKESLKLFAGDLKNSFKDLLPIIIVVALFQGAIIQAVPDNLPSIVTGLTIVR